MASVDPRVQWFVDARYGMFIHFGLYSVLARGEWVMNREQIPPADYAKLADTFKPDQFDADAICRLAVDAGMTYIVFTTMHHDGFRLYHSDLTDFCSTKTGSKRDFTAEIIEACRKHNLKIGLYHSLNNWYDQPDGVAALENPADYELFIDNTFKRIRELLERYNPVDIMWYDGWWPYHAKGWKSVEMNKMVASIQPNIVINRRNGLAGDYASPEQHMTMPNPWRPWEACMTLNDHWGYHVADDNWKPPAAVVKMLATAANGVGNLLLNIGPRGDGSLPEVSEQILRKVGHWIREEGGHEAVFNTDTFTFGYHFREQGPGDFDPNCALTARGNTLYATVRFVPGDHLVLAGVEPPVRRVTHLGRELTFSHQDGKLRVELPADVAGRFCPVLKIDCDGQPCVYRTGGMRTPKVPHPRYDPVESDIKEVF